MDGRRVGLIGGGLAFAVVAALAGTFTVTHALTIEDERGTAVNVPPVVVSIAKVQGPTATPTPAPSQAPVEVPAAPVEAPPVEVVTAPRPKAVTPPAPVAPVAPVQAPAPVPPAAPQVPNPVVPPVDSPRPEWPSDGGHKWSKFASIEEAAAWAKQQGWSEQRVRNWLHDYADRRGWKH